jgi:uncharacterized protein YraI
MNRLRDILALMMIAVVAALAGCTLSTEDEEPTTVPRPTLGTPIAWATARPDVPALLLPTATAFVFPTPTAAPTLTAPPTESALPTKEIPPTLTATLTRTPFAIFTATTAPTLTATTAALATPTAAPTLTLGAALTRASSATPTIPPSFTPWFIPTHTPLPTSAPAAQVCSTCGNLRLRASPGTAGTIVTLLAANAPLSVIGRTADSAWVQVVLGDGTSGWVSAQYLTLTISLSAVSVTGAAQDAPTAIAAGIGVVSGVSSNARRIFLDGLARGNLPHAFTRVGDSISAAPQFLTQIGSGTYQLGEYSYLGTAISFFSGPNGRGANPFAASSIAARNGWSTESVLNPANADSGICRAGETPLVCEYRLTRPAVALIMFGTNDSGGMPTATFQANLQTIVQTSLNMGVIPVLSTIPPKRYNPATDGRVAEFNQVIIATARAYDVPLWDYYSALVGLPNNGLSSDGVHPSTPPSGVTTLFDAANLRYGYTVRNFTALQVLYTLWQQILYDADQAIPATAPPAGGVPTSAPTSAPGGLGDVACLGVRPSYLTVGGQGRVTPGLPNKVRNAPGTAAAAVGSIPGDAIFAVMGGPRCADGYLWWQVNYNGLVGWTAAGSSTEDWVIPYP